MPIDYHTIERQVGESIDRALLSQIDELTTAAITEVFTNHPEVKAGLTKLVMRLIQRTLVHLEQEEAT